MRTEQLAGLTVRLCGGSDGDGNGSGPVVVLLHGFGAPGTDLVPLWRELNAPKQTRWVFPEGPIAIPFGPDARAWWEIDMMRLQKAMMSGRQLELVNDVPAGLAAARALITALLEALPARLNASPSQILLGGFSQGAMLSLDVALRSKLPLAGLALLSGTVLCESEWLPLMPARKGLRVLQSHGRQDDILPFALAERLRSHLTNAGLSVDFVPFSGGHGIPGSVLDHFETLLQAIPSTA